MISTARRISLKIIYKAEGLNTYITDKWGDYRNCSHSFGLVTKVISLFFSPSFCNTFQTYFLQDFVPFPKASVSLHRGPTCPHSTLNTALTAPAETWTVQTVQLHWRPVVWQVLWYHHVRDGRSQRDLVLGGRRAITAKTETAYFWLQTLRSSLRKT